MELEAERERAERLASASGASLSHAQLSAAAITSSLSEWSAWDLCESFAHQKGFKLTGGGYDTYKAAHSILEDALAGVINFSFPPPAQQ